MGATQYALVSYVHGPVGQFVEELRRELSPEEGLQRAHITVLPPRPLCGEVSHALEMMERVTRAVPPFEISLGDVETFLPRTATVFIRVAYGAYRLRELHDHLNHAGLCYEEPMPYMPHLTLFKMADTERARHGMITARDRWDQWEGERKVRVEQLSFVKGNQEEGWEELGVVTLGQMLTHA